MILQVKDIMTTHVQSVSSGVGLDVLEDELSKHAISGVPVIDDGKVVGVVSRSDIIKRLNIEHTYAVMAYDYYEGPFITHSVSDEANQLGSLVGNRMEHLTVKDIMNQSIKSVSSGQSIAEAAKLMLEHKVHRLLVIDEKLVGIISSTDFVKHYSVQE